MIAVLMCILSATFLAQGNLQVFAPKCATQKLPKPLLHTLATFGETPYGHTFSGELFMPDEENELLCDTNTTKELPQAQNGLKRFLLVKRGVCKFTTKIINGQKMGADLVIVYDNVASTTANVVMKNDGHGHLVTGPSLFISNSDGISLAAAIDGCKTAQLKIEFEVFQSEKANMTLWLDLTHRESYVLIRDFYERQYYSVIREFVNLELQFKVYPGCPNLFCKRDDCIGTKHIVCFPTPIILNQNVHVVDGSIVLEEQLRSYFLLTHLPTNWQELWWKYMNKFDDNACFEEPSVSECSVQAMKDVGVSDKIISNIDRSVRDTKQSVDLGSDNAFTEFSKNITESDILIFPEASINGKNFYGMFRAPQIFEMLCESLKDMPDKCKNFLKDYSFTEGENHTGGVWKLIILILVLMSVGFLFALLIYNRLVKRELNQQMSLQVNSIVEKYVRMTEQRSISKSKLHEEAQS